MTSGQRSSTAAILVGFLLASSLAASPVPRLLKDIHTTPVPPDPRQLVGAGPLVFFWADRGGEGTELWRSDATDAGTFRIRDLCAGLCSSGPYGLRTGLDEARIRRTH